MAVASADNKLTLWDFSVIVDDSQQNMELNGLQIPAQLMFLHQGQMNMKELRFHPQYHSLLLSTSEDSFNIFRPNLDPEDEEEEEKKEEEKAGAASIQRADYQVDSDEDEEMEEKRVMRTAKMLNKQRRARSSSKHKAKRRRTDN